MESACRRMRLGHPQQRGDECVVVEVNGDERLRGGLRCWRWVTPGGPCLPGVSGPTGVSLWGGHLGGELLAQPQGAACPAGGGCSPMANRPGLVAEGK